MADSNLVDFDQPAQLTKRELKQLMCGYLTVFREMGMRTLRAGNVEEALRKFHAAAAAFPDDVRNLLGRGQSRFYLKLLRQAQADTEKVLKMNDYNKEAILLQARCEYDLGNPEDALLMLCRGANKRGLRQEFKEGKQAVLSTLENCVGRHSGDVLFRSKARIQAMPLKEQKMRELEKQKKLIHCLEDQKPIYSCSDEEWRRLQLKKKKRYTQIASVYLDKLANEIQFNEKLVTDPDPKVRKMAQHALRETKDLLGILQARRPLYHLQHKYQSCQKIKTKEKSKLMENELTRLNKNAQHMLKNIQQLAYQHEFKKCTHQAHRLKLLTENFPEPEIGRKNQYLNALSDVMGQIFFQLKRNDPRLSKEDNYKRMEMVLGQNQQFNDIYFDWISDLSSFPFFDAKSWIKSYKEFVSISENHLELAWLHHELARAYIIIHKWLHAAAEARKCDNHAKLCGHDIWQANALFLITICECRRKDGEALQVLKQTFSIGYKIQNENFIELLQILKNIIEEKGIEPPYDALAANTNREEDIIKLMDGEDAKGRARDLFARMRYLRGDRRMPLIPFGVKFNKRQDGTLSIIPGGKGGRLGLHATTDQTYYEFVGGTYRLRR